MEFKVGDIVEAFGVRGEVRLLENNSHYPVVVLLENGIKCNFTQNGLNLSWHKAPTLILVSRPKKKVTKTIEYFVNLYKNGVLGDIYHTLDMCSNARCEKEFLQVVKLTGSYEIEE